ncbi:MAG: hypothetical protein FWC15_03085 [Fibromonadales bacterium]|nr:hypothetical protein [Fibromonadales bacterium]
MIFRKAIIFCLLLCAAAFADTTAVDTTVATVADTAVADTINIAIADTIAANTVTVNTTVADSAKIKPGLHFFASIGAQFINFKGRSKFKELLDTQFVKYNDYYNADPTGFIIPEKQEFQTANLAFPIMAGLIWQFSDVHSVGLGAGFVYNSELVVLTDKHGESRNYEYALQAFPLFAEYRLLISPDFISMKNGDYFSLFLRYYWMLPGTEIYSSWGNAKAYFDPLGSGFGVFLGYRFWEWEGFSIWGELGYLSLEVKSSDKNAILNSWDLGGVALMLRAMF